MARKKTKKPKIGDLVKVDRPSYQKGIPPLGPQYYMKAWKECPIQSWQDEFKNARNMVWLAQPCVGIVCDKNLSYVQVLVSEFNEILWFEDFQVEPINEQK